MAERKTGLRVIHHVVDGAVPMYEIDARHALSFKDEWKDRPWKDHEVEAYKRRKAKQAKDAAPEPMPEPEVEADEDEGGEE